MVSIQSAVQQAGFTQVTANSSLGSASIPVSPAEFIYTQFSHVRGTPAGPGETPVSVSHVQIINTLIEHLVNRGKRDILENIPEFSGFGENSAKTDNEVLIDKIRNSINQTMEEAKDLPYISPFALSPVTGNLVNILG